jgi:predicted permease
VALAADVSANYFEVLGVAPAAGRFFTADEAGERESAFVVVLGHALWTQSYARDPDVVGRVVRVNGHPLTVVGVVPAGFTGAMIGAVPDVFVPIGLHARLQPGRDPMRRGMAGMRTWLQMFGRLSPGVTASEAEGRLAAVAQRLRAAHQYPEGWAPAGVKVRAFGALPPRMRSAVAGFLSLLFAAAALVLVIASVNVAGMLLARGAAHRREIAIRVALGAGRARLVRQFLAESLLVAAVGAAAGVLLAAWLTGVFVRVRPPFAERFQIDVPLDASVLGFAVLAAVVSGLLFGLLPALHLTRATPMLALREASPTAAADRGRLRSALVTGQIALSLVLLVAAGLFVRTLQRALAAPQPMRSEGVLALSLNLGLNGYDATRGHAFYEELLARLRALPGVESAAVASIIPLEPSWDQVQIVVPGVEAASPVTVGRSAVSAGYFEMLKMPLLAGRFFSAPDARGPARAMVVNETFARRFWPDGSAVGQRVRRDGAELEIVGVVPDGKYRATDEEPTLYAYLPLGPGEYQASQWIHVRPRGAAGPAVAAVRAQLAALDPDMPPVMVTTMDDVMGTALFAPRLAAALVGGFGLAGLLLSAVGLFGLLSYLVAQRTREIGVRIALGARPLQVVRLVMGQALRPLAAGVGLGLLAALAAARSLSALLHGLSPTDPVTFTLVPLALVAVALAAGVIPARRASRVDPVTALRSD